MEYKEGQTFRVVLNGFNREVKIHIMYVIDSIYHGHKLIVFRYWGKRSQYWHEEVLIDIQLKHRISLSQ